MLLRKTAWFWKSGLAVISFVLMLSISGCSDTPPEEAINICIDLYEKAAEENKLADLETIRSIVNRLGENGYPAVDSRNQINMTEANQVLEFCEKVDAREEAEINTSTKMEIYKERLLEVIRRNIGIIQKRVN